MGDVIDLMSPDAILRDLRDVEAEDLADRVAAEATYHDGIQAMAEGREVDGPTFAAAVNHLGKASRDVTADLEAQRELITLQSLAGRVAELDRAVVVAYEAHQGILAEIQESYRTNQERAKAAHADEVEARQQHAKAVAARETLKARGLWSE